MASKGVGCLSAVTCVRTVVKQAGERRRAKSIRLQFWVVGWKLVVVQLEPEPLDHSVLLGSC